jgi:hypothetical protein
MRALQRFGRNALAGLKPVCRPGLYIIYGGGEVGVEQAMEEVFAGFATDGEASGDVGAGAEAALDGIADGHVFVLNLFTDGYALTIVRGGGLGYVGEVVVEDHGAFVDRERDDEIGVHHAFVGVDHEIGIEPEIEGAALARGGDAGGGTGIGGERAGLQASALEIFDGVLGVFDDAAQAFVGVGDVVAAVEIVVDVNFPVAIEGVDAAIEVLELLGELQRSDEFRNGGEEFAKRGGLGIEIDEDEIFPGVDGDGDEAILRAIEVADAVELDHAFEGAVDTVGPAVIGAAKLPGAAVGFGDDGGSVMAANIVEGAELRVVAADDDDGLAGDVSCKERTVFTNLIEAAGGLPAFSEDGRELQFVNAWVAIPRRGNGRGLLQRIAGIVQVQDFADALAHGLLNAGRNPSYRENGEGRRGK